ncbi:MULTISPECIES: ABC transporter permease [unclassified Aureimonas]|uniref:ABC transporter permease n=1 Tax=unclassified Aureimonas TaxID=2615206 RepID=UPI0006F6F3BA|nr:MULTISPECIES: iron ABC transporter permease [unclassified Aureimonas]KQT69781.1 iron ABC transporter permease [Aureimonas sp. Leaf427]KQT76067.1 iron ABC transporter permease [Aureimonas sp. Leaf460]
MSASVPIAKPAAAGPVGRSRHDRAYLAAGILVALAVILPLASLLVIALSGSAANWPHIAQSILPQASRVTLLLMLGVAILSGTVGVLTAWLVATFDFPGRRLFAWALVLPLAVPTYIAAYCFVEFLHFTGPVQTGLRALFGFETRRDYWFPDVRSLGGAVVILSSVLYPYVFLTVRMVFLMQGRKAADVARTLGASRARVFFRVLLPMARPAIAVGVTLALMEAVNDIGAVEFLGVRTLTFAVYSTWLNRGDLEGATQIALLMLSVIVALVAIERFARRRQRFTLHRADRPRAGRERLGGGRAWLATVACLLPIASGFGIPAVVLGAFAMRRLDQAADPQLWRALLHTVAIAGAAGAVTVAAAFVMAYGIRLTHSKRLATLARIGALGYAVPGTVLAIGILVPLAAFDNALDAAMRASFGVSTGLLLSGSGFAIVYACFVRFMAMGHGSVESGFAKLSSHFDMAARTLGRGPGGTLREVLLPLMRPAVLTAFLLVFVDASKELSATILLRPFDFETLATFVYASASRSAFEDGALAALLIVLVGILPVILLTRSLTEAVSEEVH